MLEHVRTCWFSNHQSPTPRSLPPLQFSELSLSVDLPVKIGRWLTRCLAGIFKFSALWIISTACGCMGLELGQLKICTHDFVNGITNNEHKKMGKSYTLWTSAKNVNFCPRPLIKFSLSIQEEVVFRTSTSEKYLIYQIPSSKKKIFAGVPP